MPTGSSETTDLLQAPCRRTWPARERPLVLNAGAVLAGRYQVVRPIGQGGMGRVLEVVRLADGLHLALKYCDGNELSRRRMVREMRILEALEHPHLLPVLDSAMTHDPPYFVMPLATGTLAADLGQAGRDLGWAVSVFRQVCSGVEALHRSGVVHRDLKPANVLRLCDGRYVVADLGAAKREPRDSTILTRTCAILGTIAYLAPEQLLPGGTRQADVRTDVFQLGKILYQMVTGRSPAVLESSLLAPPLRHVVERATAGRPEHRYPDVATLLEAVETVLDASSEDPCTDPLGTLQQVLSSVDSPLDTRLRDLRVLEALSQLEGLTAGAVLDGFDLVPTHLLVTLSRDQPRWLLGPLALYAQSLRRAAARRPFDYADRVAERMRAVFLGTTNDALAVQALRALLVAAVALNRYAAMGVLRQLLYQVRAPGLALPVAEMLRDHREEFQEIVPGLRVDRLHPILRAVLDDLDWIETVSF